jgi:hypothetical protein
LSYLPTVYCSFGPLAIFYFSAGPVAGLHTHCSTGPLFYCPISPYCLYFCRANCTLLS